MMEVKYISGDKCNCENTKKNIFLLEPNIT